MTRWLPAGGALLLAGLIGGCVNDPAEVAALREVYDLRVEVAREVRTLYSDSAQLRVIVEAPTMYNHTDPTDPRQEFPDGLHVTFLDEAQDTNSTLIAQWGVYRQRNNLITVRDSVVWQSVDGQRLETEELNWDEKRERIHTNKFVVLTQPDFIITGHGLEADPGFTDARVLQVDGRIPVSKPTD